MIRELILKEFQMLFENKSSYEDIKKYLDSKNINDYYISFTKIPKLGINPKSIYATPLGIYAYPLKEISELYDWENEEDIIVPFPPRHERKYLFIFKFNGSILELNKYTDEDFKNDSKQLFTGGFNFNQETPGKAIWELTRFNAIDEYDIEKDVLKISTNWNKIFRNLGYDGVIDYSTNSKDAIIHPQEPTQAVFFDYRYIEIIDMFKYKNIVSEYERVIDSIYDDNLKTFKFFFKKLNNEEINNIFKICVVKEKYNFLKYILDNSKVEWNFELVQNIKILDMLLGHKNLSIKNLIPEQIAGYILRIKNYEEIIKTFKKHGYDIHISLAHQISNAFEKEDLEKIEYYIKNHFEYMVKYIEKRLEKIINYLFKRGLFDILDLLIPILSKIENANNYIPHISLIPYDKREYFRKRFKDEMNLTFD